MTHDTDAFGLWRPDAAFRLMQDLSGAHSDALGFSREDLLKRNRIWMLARVKFTIDSYPCYNDLIRAKTWYGEPSRITFPRYIDITDANGRSFAFFSTSWVVVDIQSRRIMLPDKAGVDHPAPADIVPLIPEPVKIRLIKAGEQSITICEPRYCDLDLNGHMNNASYVGWVLDLFPMSWHSEHRIHSIMVSYSAEAKPNKPVRLILYRDGLNFEVQGIDETAGHIVFEAQGEWMDI